MADPAGIFLEPRFKLLVCKRHEAGVRPTKKAIERHLRSSLHSDCKGRVLKEAVSTLVSLGANSPEALQRMVPSILDQPIIRIEYLQVLDGWSCLTCEGKFLTTSKEILCRHVAESHGQRARKHSPDNLLWEPCQLQTFFSETRERRYFRVACNETGTTANRYGAKDVPQASTDSTSMAHRPPLDEVREQQATQLFLEQLEQQRLQHRAAQQVIFNTNPEPSMENGATELWMKQLSLDVFVAGLQKQEMASSYALPSLKEQFSDIADPLLLELCRASDRVLQQTRYYCLPGPKQRLTDAQAARIGRFWPDADPDGRARPFYRTIDPTTFEVYCREWKQLLAFHYRGWKGQLFTKSLAALSKAETPEAEADEADDSSGYSGSSCTSVSSTTSNNTGGGGANTTGSRVSFPLEGSPLDRFYRCTVRQRTLLQKFADRFSNEQAEDGDQGAEARKTDLEAHATAIAASLIQQTYDGWPFQSPVVAYASMHCVNPGKRAWKQASDFNHHLSGLIYCAQLWVIRFAWQLADANANTSGKVAAEISSAQTEIALPLEDLPSRENLVDEKLHLLMDRWMSNDRSTPLAQLLLWRRRLFGYVRKHVANRPATWDSKQNTLTISGVSVSLEDMRHLCRFTLERARHCLFEELMFGIDYLPTLGPADLKDDDTNRTIGWWFAQHPANVQVLAGSDKVLLEHIANKSILRDLYWQEDTIPAAGDDSGPVGAQWRWRTNAISYYESKVQEFLHDLATLVHFRAGPPVRAPEFLTPMWKNTERLRNICLLKGKVMVHLTSHKMMSTTGANVNNVRFLDYPESILLLNYLIYVIPLREWMSCSKHSPISTPISPYLWSSESGEKWKSRNFGNMLRAACKRAGIAEIGTALWRQMAAAIVNTHFDRPYDRACLLAAQEATQEAEEEGAGAVLPTLIRMFNHSTTTHQLAYANSSRFANVWDALLSQSEHASEIWARFFAVPPEQGVIYAPLQTRGENIDSNDEHRYAQHKRVSSGAAREQQGARKILNIGLESKRRRWSGLALLQEARLLYENMKLTWTCAEQQQAMELVANKVPEALVILATGAGKTLLFMLATKLPGARTTVLIVPLVLLRLDLLRRCRKLGINALVWEGPEFQLAGEAALLIASVEAAARPAFLDSVHRLKDQGSLDRIVIDECHLIITSAHYRRQMGQLNILRQFKVPFVYMTATLPPRLEQELCSRHHIAPTAQRVRGCTARPNLSYSVEQLHPPEGESFLESACREILDAWERMMADHPEWHGPRVMVFVRTPAIAEKAAELLGCQCFHRQLGTVEEKERRLNEWTSGKAGSLILACTTAAGTGVDYAHVRWVVHIGEPYGLIDFAQESGRAGRDGVEALSTVLLQAEATLGQAQGIQAKSAGGRGGRASQTDGPPKGEITRLRKPPIDCEDVRDFWALQQYLGGLECRRLCLAQGLDEERFWKTCRKWGDECETCDICSASPEEVGGELEEALKGEGKDANSSLESRGRTLNNNACWVVAEARDPEYPNEESEEWMRVIDEGAIRQARQMMEEQKAKDDYLARLSQVKDTCMLCRIIRGQDTSWRHSLDECREKHKWEYLRCKQRVVERTKSRTRGWMKAYIACWWCGQPQEVCEGWKEEEQEEVGKIMARSGKGGGGRGGKCEFRDLVLPTAWALWQTGKMEQEWMVKIMDARGIELESSEDLLITAGIRVGKVGGLACTKAVEVLARYLERMEG